MSTVDQDYQSGRIGGNKTSNLELAEQSAAYALAIMELTKERNELRAQVEQGILWGKELAECRNGYETMDREIQRLRAALDKIAESTGSKGKT